MVRLLRFVCILVTIVGLICPVQADTVANYAKGDANSSGTIDLSDGIFILQYLFAGKDAPLCEGLSDADSNGTTELTDAVSILRFLFQGSVTIGPLTEDEIAECDFRLTARCGIADFESPDPAGNAYSCSRCHSLEPASTLVVDGVRNVAHGLGDAAMRENFYSGQISDLLGAVNRCRIDWMDAPGWNFDDPAWVRLQALLTVTAGDDPAPPVVATIAQPAVFGPSNGDKIRGCDLFVESCATCHGETGDGVTDLGPSIWSVNYSADQLRSLIRLSGPTDETVPSTTYDGLLGNHMPFWSRERLSDTDLEDLVAYLTIAQNPSKRTCEQVSAPELLRVGAFRTRMHGVRGRVEHWSDRTIRLKSFYYDGRGPELVLVWLYFENGDRLGIFDGYGISEHLARPRAYINEDLIFPIPDEITDDMFNAVSIWCTEFAQNYGEAEF